jgi:hypothetical protein
MATATRAISRRRSARRYTFRSVRHRAKHMTVSLAILAGLAPTAAFAIEGFRIGGDQGGLVEAMHRVTMRLTGYEWKGGGFSMGELAKGWTPLLAGAVAHKLANRFGVNRMLAKSGIPFIRI